MQPKAKPTFFELLRQSMRDVEGGYDLLAPKFDASRYITPEFILKPFFEKLQKEKGSFKNGIDVCCGTGAASLHLVKRCQENFTALDLSQKMLEQCKKKINHLNPKPKISFIKGNALNMPFREEFDVAVSFGAFGHILKRDEKTFIQQIHKILKPGGHFYFVTTTKLPWWSSSLWRARIFNAIISVRNFLIHPKFIMYYLTFRLPKVKNQLEEAGFEVIIFDDIFKPDDENISDLMTLKYFKMVKAVKK